MIPTANFMPEEFHCPCCGEERMEQEFVDKLQEIRTELDFPLYISSGYRCLDHNARVGGSKWNHPAGVAVDIAIEGHKAHALIGAAVRHGILGIGVKQKGQGRFIHLDMTDAPGVPRPWVWSY